jgi:hypothetical protein
MFMPLRSATHRATLALLPVPGHREHMSHETINLICAELPGTEKVALAPGVDGWTVGGEPFARVVGEKVEVRRGDVGEAAWAALPLGGPEAGLRPSIVEAYELVRGSVPQEVQVTLDRTSG